MSGFFNNWMLVFAAACCAIVEARLGDKLEPSSATGTSASLTEDGYQLVASLKNDAEMGAYIRRILASEGKQVRTNADSEVDGFVPFFSGTRGTQSLRTLRHELQKVNWTNRASNLEVDMALDTLKSERISSMSNVSAYAMAIAGALSSPSQGGSSRTRVFVEADLGSKPLKQLSEELAETQDAKAQVVFQREDGKVIVTSARDMALELIKSPLKRWTEAMNAKRKEAASSIAESPLTTFEASHSLVPVGDNEDEASDGNAKAHRRKHHRRQRPA